MTIRFSLNGQTARFEGDPQMPLLWYLRDYANLTGTKFGCGIGSCRACTVHIDGRAAPACVTRMVALQDRAVTTIEGLASNGALHAVQRAWIEEDVVQCGYCQAGQIMAAVDLLARRPDPNDADVASLANLCRCGTYPRIRRAIRRAATLLREEADA